MNRSRGQPGQRRILLSFCATRAFTSFLISAVGSGLSVGKWMVPLDVEKPLSSFLNTSITDAVRNKLQWLENAANHTSTPLYLILERRNPIADGLGSLRRHSGSNRRANLVQGAAGGFRDTSKVFINVFRSAVAFRRRTAIARFHFFHVGNATRTSTSSPCPRPSCIRLRLLGMTVAASFSAT